MSSTCRRYAKGLVRDDLAAPESGVNVNIRVTLPIPNVQSMSWPPLLTLTLLSGLHGRQTLFPLTVASTATCHLAFLTSDARQYTRHERPFEGSF